jgi:hypothetical protein
VTGGELGGFAGVEQQRPPVAVRHHRVDVEQRGLWVPESRFTLCDLLILVEQPVEPVSPSDTVGRVCRGLGERS